MTVQRPIGSVLLVLGVVAGSVLFAQRTGRPVAVRKDIRPVISRADVRLAPPSEKYTQQETATTDMDDDAIVDLYGNEVRDAVAKYKLDATGSLYELHSPRTEVPHLTSPKS